MNAEASGRKTGNIHIPLKCRAGEVKIVFNDAQTSLQPISGANQPDGVRYPVCLVTVVGRGTCGQVGGTSSKQNGGI